MLDYLAYLIFLQRKYHIQCRKQFARKQRKQVFAKVNELVTLSSLTNKGCNGFLASCDLLLQHIREQINLNTEKLSIEKSQHSAFFWLKRYLGYRTFKPCRDSP